MSLIFVVLVALGLFLISEFLLWLVFSDQFPSKILTVIKASYERGVLVFPKHLT